MLKSSSTEEIYRLFLEAGSQITTDTRRPVKGSMFFALKGPNFNANTFAAKALESGCSVAVVDEEAYAGVPGTVLVEDGLVALQQLARHHRRQFNIPVLAITGSNAKTTSKELINAVLSGKYRTLATEGNLNNHIGVPLTLLKITAEHQIAIIEMGANHRGEIAALCDIAEPTYGLITNIGKAHLEGFGGIEGVKAGKGELYRFLEKQHGLAFVNGDDPVLLGLAGKIKTYTYGSRSVNDVIGKDCSTTQTVSLKYTSGEANTPWETTPLINTKMTGAYNYINCLAAACLGVYFDVPGDAIRSALETYTPEMNRSQVVQTAKNTLILDAYNANPDSMKVAIQNFAVYKAGKKMVILGDMFELGEYSAMEHLHIVEQLKAATFDNVLLAGPEFCRAAGNTYRCFKDTAECRSYLASLKPEGFTVLIKGSRSMKMESLKEVL